MLYDDCMATRLSDEPNVDLHIWIPRLLKAQVWAAAKAADLSPSQWLRQAVRSKLEQEARDGVLGS